MILTFGGVPIGDMNACAIEPRTSLLRDERGRGHGLATSYTFDCTFAVGGQADCAIKMAIIEAALATPNGDLLFLNDNGTPSVNSVLSAATLTGVRCVGWTWKRDAGAQFMSWRGLTGVFEWETRLPVAAGFLLAYSEVVKLRNPVGSDYVVNEFVNGVASTARATVQFPKSTATQNGFAVGLSEYPDINFIAPPLWVGSPPLKSFEPEYTTPKRKGDAGFEGYRVAWAYAYESPLPLIALPHVWI